MKKLFETFQSYRMESPTKHSFYFNIGKMFKWYETSMILNCETISFNVIPVLQPVYGDWKELEGL